MTPAQLVRHSLDPNFAIKGVFLDRQWPYKVAVGGVVGAATALAVMLNMQNVLFVPVALALYGLMNGYFLRLLRARIADPQCDLPEWDNWIDLWWSGITWISVVFGWTAMCLGMVISVALIAYLLSAKGSSWIVISETAACILLFTLLLFRIILSYLMLNFATEERVAAGFAFRKILRLLRKNPKAFCSAWILAFWIEFVSIVVPAVTVIGIFFVPSTWFAGQLMAFTLLSQAWQTVEDK